MTEKRGFRLLLISLLLFAGVFIFLFLLPSRTFDADDNAEIHIKAKELITAYISDENKADKMYTNKFIQVSGSLKSIKFLNNRNTLIIDQEKGSSGVICDLNNTQTEKVMSLIKNQKIEVKGICKGFLKDVILLNCYIETDE